MNQQRYSHRPFVENDKIYNLIFYRPRPDNLSLRKIEKTLNAHFQKFPSLVNFNLELIFSEKIVSYIYFK